MKCKNLITSFQEPSGNFEHFKQLSPPPAEGQIVSTLLSGSESQHLTLFTTEVITHKGASTFSPVSDNVLNMNAGKRVEGPVRDHIISAKYTHRVKEEDPINVPLSLDLLTLTMNNARGGREIHGLFKERENTTIIKTKKGQKTVIFER